MRTCVGCRLRDEPEEMVRVVDLDSGEVAVDLAGRAFGRGAWVHARPACLSSAASGGLSRSFRRSVTVSEEALAQSIRAAADRRVAALIGAARGSGHLKVGSDACRDAISAGQAVLLVVATDARAAARSIGEEAAGRSLFWGTKAELGAAAGRSDAGVVALLDRGFAGAIARTVGLSKTPTPPLRSRVARSHVSVEVE